MDDIVSTLPDRKCTRLDLALMQEPPNFQASRDKGRARGSRNARSELWNHMPKTMMHRCNSEAFESFHNRRRILKR